MKRQLTIAVIVLLAFFAGYATSTAQINAFPSYYEDFENGDGGWTPGGQNSSWEMGYPYKSYIYGAASGNNCWTTGMYSYNSDEYSYLTSPSFDFSCFTSDPTLQFNLAYWTEAYDPYQAGYDFCWVEYSLDGGGSWQVLGTAGTGSNWYNYNWYDWNYGYNWQAWGGDDYYGYGYSWDRASNTIPGSAGKPNVKLRFVMYSDGYYELDGMGVDDINIFVNNPTLVTPTLILPANNAINQLVRPTLSWTATGCATGYDVQIATDAAFTNLVQSITNNTTTSYTPPTALNNGTTYYWRTRARSAIMLSSWSTTRTFTTVFPTPPTPVLVVPDNGATAQQLTTSLSWNPALGAATYNLQVSTDPTFATTVVNATLTGTSYNFTTTTNFATYYWRVNATNITGTSAYSAVWNFRTIIGTPSPATPTSGITGVLNPVNVSWTGVPGAISYDIQAATDASFTVLTYNGNISGTTAMLTGLLDNNQYFWRIRAVADAVERSNWSSVWTFSTMVGTPSLAKPFDGALDQPQTITISWNAVQGQATYNVQVASDILFKNLVVNKTNVAGTSVDVTGLQPNTLYYWRIQASNPTNGTGSWSNTFTFNTIVGKVTGIAPLNARKGVTLPVSLEWSNAGANRTYQIEIALDAQFKNIVVTDEKIGSTIGVYGRNAGLKDYTQYYWRVRPISQTNIQIPWSDVLNFVTNIGAPVLMMPANNAVNQKIATTLTWVAPAGATKYTVRVYEDTDIKTLEFEDVDVVGTSIMPTGLEPESKYIWTVQATDADNYTSEWSASWKFATTTVFAAVPTLDKPANNAMDAALAPTLEWKEAEYAQTYDVQVSSYSNFSSTLVNLTGLTAVTLPVSGLSSGERYFWRVRSVNAAGPSAWSETWTFVVSAQTPAIVSLFAPGNGADKQEVNVSLQWTELSGGVTYQLQVSENNTFTSTVLDKSSLALTTYGVSGLQPLTTYYWRVRGQNTAGDGPWSDVWSFKTKEVNSVNDELVLSGATLEVIYPNPVTHNAAIGFTLARPATATLSVVNALGNTVATLGTGEFADGTHSFVWETDNMPSGMYAVRLSIGGASLTRMVNVVK